MAKLEVIEATDDHAIYIAEHLREADKDELDACGVDPLKAMLSGLKTSSYVKSGIVNNKPCFMFGVAPLSVLSGTGIPWMLGTNDVNLIKKKFIKHSKYYLEISLRFYPYLKNYVDVRNKASIRWLKWMGFTLLPEVKYGLNDEPFYPFEMRR